MAIQTYCDRSDLEDIIGAAAVFASIDDDQNGVESASETLLVTRAIERAANKINGYVEHQYKLADVAANEWLTWANAVMACYALRTRRNNPAEQSITDDYNEVSRMLIEIRWGRDQLPNQAPSFNHLPTVSNFQPELNKGVMPIRVDEEESTGNTPSGAVKRFTAKTPGSGYF